MANRIKASPDEVELIIDALRVFEIRLRELGTRNSGNVANRVRGLSREIENGSRIE
jgi:hypothetical protein